ACSGNKAALLDQIREGAQLKKVEQNSRPVSASGRDALLDQIRQGIQLKKVEQNSRPVSASGRDALLDQIRQGIQLKKTETQEKNPLPSKETIEQEKQAGES
uniref:Neural Wiskott-Aldrich syndrome protein n=1 Tax=Mus musculus TaxID=10090 RepID=UPI0001DD2115|nr:Chain W, Neural Wiskott-Aldrich syndrome protein [Mus musculus]